MATEHEIQETISRCVSTMVFYRNSGKTSHSKNRMTAEIGAIADGVKDWRSMDDPCGRILDAVNTELVARYGSELGVRLDGEFYRVFVQAHLPAPVDAPAGSFR